MCKPGTQLFQCRGRQSGLTSAVSAPRGAHSGSPDDCSWNACLVLESMSTGMAILGVGGEVKYASDVVNELLERRNGLMISALY